MKLKNGEVVTLRHYSGGSLNKSIIIGAKSDTITLKPTREYVIFNYFENDPIVIGYDYNSEIYIGEGTVLGIDYRSCIVDVKVNFMQLITDKRDIERYPTSLYANVKNLREKGIAYIRNISKSGMSMYSRAMLNEGQEIEIEMNLKEKPLSVKAEVVWRQQGSSDFEYGIKIINMDFNDKSMLEKYLENLNTEQEKLTKKMKDESSLV